MSPSTWRVLVADDSPPVREMIAALLSEAPDLELVAEAGNGADALRLALELEPDLVLMDLKMPVQDGLEATAQLLRQRPGARVVVLSSRADPDVLLEAMEVGARDFVRKPFEGPALLDTLRRVLSQPDAPPPPLASLEQAPPPAPLPGAGVWLFVAPGAGSGRTTLVLSAAAELLQLEGRVLVVDADLHFGDASYFLGLTGRGRTFAELLAGGRRVSQARLESHVHRHPSGIHLLGPAPITERYLGPRPTQLVEVVREARKAFDHVLVDLAAGLPPELAPLAQDAEGVVAVSDSRPERLKNLVSLCGHLRRLGVPEKRLHPLVVALAPGDSRALLGEHGVELAGELPRDIAALRKAHEGTAPVSVAAPDSPYAQALRTAMQVGFQLPIF